LLRCGIHAACGRTLKFLPVLIPVAQRIVFSYGCVKLRVPSCYDKERLLANGDRWEREIARNIALDAPYR
jgi:hypothetical protein